MFHDHGTITRVEGLVTANGFEVHRGQIEAMSHIRRFRMSDQLSESDQSVMQCDGT